MSERDSVSTPTASPAASDRLAAMLKRHFGHEQFRPMQRQIIDESLAGRDVFVLMPTGSGKSLCYQLPALMRQGVTVVVSPLIALMQDQVKALEANGIHATVLNSTVDARGIARREAAVIAGEYNLVYMAPERLMGPAGARLMSRLRIGLFAVDEAHCISEWGHDFRPEYRMLGQLRQRFGDVPIMGLTATATLRVADDVVQQLHLRDPAIFRSGFERQNLYYEVRPKHRMFEQIAKYLQDNPLHEGVIYTHSRAGAEDMAARLKGCGVAALPYHAGLDASVRQKNQHDFIYGDTRVMTATIAFGMGINKPDVRFVFHADLPRHLEGYYQETGRAGRDGLPADCILFFSPGDRAKIERFIQEKQDAAEREHAYWQLKQMVTFAYATGCRCVPLLKYFGQEHDGACGHCDNCRQAPKVLDATEDARKLLSAVARTEQRFGLGHVVDVLRGNLSEKVARYGHQELSVFGIGRGAVEAHWRRIAEALIHNGQLAQTAEQYPTLHLTNDSLPVLRGQVAVSVPQPRALREGKGAKRARRLEPANDLPVDAELFQALRDLRRRVAQEQAVPPYVVFSDAALRQMAQIKPTTLERFAQITGVGQFKLKQYGEMFIQAIAAAYYSNPPTSEP